MDMDKIIEIDILLEKYKAKLADPSLSDSVKSGYKNMIENLKLFKKEFMEK
ncbi:hypothetical protein BX659_11565 [Orenia metallireducens]|uniref:Uncharacterized protein n=1 Tax=Orenia metallireducens TaxID=1413210 RepID=A0A285HGB6_9FIRM|nr:hypothetical protein [Orenia metallireducens]PRX27739.1 hypothetical protein BX659_11565 [Orenia metallireducens]SNY33751.1 hypothetical protein SAMN06265827_11765 [Orenia metallireducens]